MIIIVDFGSQTTHLISRRLRKIGVQSEFVIPEDSMEKINELKPAGIILSGGPMSVYEEGAPDVTKQLFDLNIPILGICYGWQKMSQRLGGDVKKAHTEYGPETLNITDESPLLHGLKGKFEVWMSHGDSVVKMPKGFKSVANSSHVEFAAVENTEKKLYGVQFHPEAQHTQYGDEVLKNFVEKICKEKLKPINLNPDQIIEGIKHEVQDKKVICAVSGGVDSTVAAFLIGKAIGKNLIPVYVESGLMRDGTKQRVEHIFSNLIKSDLQVVEARDRFMSALKGIEDPEIKRKTIGKLYVDIFQEIALKHKDAEYLGQGTIYSDVIESKGSKHASNIKSHHNVGGLPKDMHLKLIEPNRYYYKDEVREIGKMVGLPDDVINQQPFPGPGYGVMIRGEVTEKRLSQVKIADTIIMEEMKLCGYYEKVFECFAVMTGAFSTANKGDARVFAEVIAIRAYESQDIMSASWAKIPYEALQKMSSRIVNEVPDVSRVVYDITTKPPATMQWE